MEKKNIKINVHDILNKLFQKGGSNKQNDSPKKISKYDLLKNKIRNLEDLIEKNEKKKNFQFKKIIITLNKKLKNLEQHDNHNKNLSDLKSKTENIEKILNELKESINSIKKEEEKNENESKKIDEEILKLQKEKNNIKQNKIKFEKEIKEKKEKMEENLKMLKKEQENIDDLKSQKVIKDGESLNDKILSKVAMWYLNNLKTLTIEEYSMDLFELFNMLGINVNNGEIIKGDKFATEIWDTYKNLVNTEIDGEKNNNLQNQYKIINKLRDDIRS